MGVGGKFWDLLKPYARQEGFDFLTNKRVAVDLSFWIIQHETAVKGFVLKPHLRLTFFRTINLFSKVPFFFELKWLLLSCLLLNFPISSPYIILFLAWANNVRFLLLSIMGFSNFRFLLDCKSCSR